MSEAGLKTMQDYSNSKHTHLNNHAYTSSAHKLVSKPERSNLKFLSKSKTEEIVMTGQKLIELVNVDGEIDDLSEHFLYKEDPFNESGNSSLARTPKAANNFLVFHSGTSTPYSSNIQCNPFSRSRNLDGMEFTPRAKSALFSSMNRHTNPENNYFNFCDDLNVYRHQENKIPLRVNKNFEICLSKNHILASLLNFISPADIVNISKITRKIKNNKCLQAVFKKTLSHRIIKGLKNNEQYRLWNCFVPFKYIKENNCWVFTNKVLKESKFTREISKDIDRTLQESCYFQQEEGRLALYRVLIAISNTWTDVGYIQGLNSIVGTLLLYLKEEDAYWMALYLLIQRNIKQLFSDQLTLVNIWNYQLEIFMQNYIPEVYMYLTQKGLEVSYLSTPWFLTLFSHYFRAPTLIKIWNLFLIHGEQIFIKLALAVFLHYKNDILTMDVDEVGGFLKSSLQDMLSDDTLMSLTPNFKISKRLLNQVSTFYKQSKRPTKLTLRPDSGTPHKLSFYEDVVSLESASENQNDTYNNSPLKTQHSRIINLNIQVPFKSRTPDAAPTKLGNILNLTATQSDTPKSLKSGEKKFQIPSTLVQNSRSDKSPLFNPEKHGANSKNQLFVPFVEQDLSKNLEVKSNLKNDDMENYDAEDIQNISQSTETMTQNPQSINKITNSSLPIFLFAETSTVQGRSASDQFSYPILRREDSLKPMLLDSEVHARIIPQFKYVNHFADHNGAPLSKYHSRKRSRSYNDQRDRNFSYLMDEKPFMNPFTSESNSSSFLTAQGDDEGYLDDDLKKELLNNTQVFTPKAQNSLPNASDFDSCLLKQNSFGITTKNFCHSDDGNVQNSHLSNFYKKNASPKRNSNFL